jgi:hypothetical protein
VSAEVALVDTRSGSLGTSVDRETILEIPLSGRDFTGLIALQAGTTVATTASTGSNQGFGNKFSIGGSRPGDNSILLDDTGVKALDQGVPMPVRMMFWAGPGSEPALIRAASAYEVATRHRVPPKAFGPLAARPETD